LKYEVLAKNLKNYRKKAKLTQKELGEKIYKSEILIRKYESGKVNIPPSTLYDICVALDVSSKILLDSDFDNYHMNNFGESSNKGVDVSEKALSLAEDYKRYGDSWRNAFLRIENNPHYLLDSIFNYLENTEKYYSSLLVNIQDNEDDSMPYLTDEQVNNIVTKVTDLVKYEIYKLEKIVLYNKD